MSRHGAPWCVIALVLVLPSRADAHRLDEYLQATRLSVAVDRVRLEIDLSPGVAIADSVIQAIDRDRDGSIQDGEAAGYAATVLRALTLSVDGRPVRLQLERRAFPSPADMREGIGTIRLVASAPVAAGGGRRRLSFANAFHPVSSAYLVNALVPSDRRITLGGQRRDPLQRTYTLDYDVAGDHAWLGWSTAMVATMGLLLVGRRRSNRISAHRHPPATLRLPEPLDRIPQRRPRHRRGVTPKKIVQRLGAGALADFTQHPADGFLNQVVRIVDEDGRDANRLAMIAARHVVRGREHGDTARPQVP